MPDLTSEEMIRVAKASAWLKAFAGQIEDLRGSAQTTQNSARAADAVSPATDL